MASPPLTPPLNPALLRTTKAVDHQGGRRGNAGDVQSHSVVGSDASVEVNVARVLNKHRDAIPDGAVYVGRPTKWGNPFVIGRDGDRSEVIRRYKEWLLSSSELMAQLDELKGRDLVCWCSPLACHADVLTELANDQNV